MNLGICNICTYIHMLTYPYIHIRILIYIYICVYIFIYIHSYSYIFMHMFKLILDAHASFCCRKLRWYLPYSIFLSIPLCLPLSPFFFISLSMQSCFVSIMYAMMRHTWTDQVCRRSKTAVQWPDLGAMHLLACLRSPDFCFECYQF